MHHNISELNWMLDISFIACVQFPCVFLRVWFTIIESSRMILLCPRMPSMFNNFAYGVDFIGMLIIAVPSGLLLPVSSHSLLFFFHLASTVATLGSLLTISEQSRQRITWNPFHLLLLWPVIVFPRYSQDQLLILLFFPKCIFSVRLTWPLSKIVQCYGYSE